MVASVIQHIHVVIENTNVVMQWYLIVLMSLLCNVLFTFVVSCALLHCVQYLLQEVLYT